MTIESNKTTIDDCTVFMRSVEITPENALEFMSRKGKGYSPIELSGMNAGVVVCAYNDGQRSTCYDVRNADWHKLKESGMVAIIGAQRQQLLATNGWYSEHALYYGIPVKLNGQ